MKKNHTKLNKHLWGTLCSRAHSSSLARAGSMPIPAGPLAHRRPLSLGFLGTGRWQAESTCGVTLTGSLMTHQTQSSRSLRTQTLPSGVGHIYYQPLEWHTQSKAPGKNSEVPLGPLGSRGTEECSWAYSYRPKSPHLPCTSIAQWCHQFAAELATTWLLLFSQLAKGEIKDFNLLPSLLPTRLIYLEMNKEYY